jgi:hypothetical protein
VFGKSLPRLARINFDKAPLPHAEAGDSIIGKEREPTSAFLLLDYEEITG